MLIPATPVGAEYLVTLCDLGIFADQAVEPVPPQDPDIRVRNGRTLTPSGRPLAERPVRTMNVIVLDVLTQEQPQVPLAGYRYQHPVQEFALAADPADLTVQQRVLMPQHQPSASLDASRRASTIRQLSSQRASRKTTEKTSRR